MAKKTLLAIAGLLLLTGSNCNGYDGRIQEANETTRYHSKQFGTITVHTVHDDARHVTCWIFYNGISCLPDKFLSDKDAPPTH